MLQLLKLRVGQINIDELSEKFDELCDEFRYCGLLLGTGCNRCCNIANGCLKKCTRFRPDVGAKRQDIEAVPVPSKQLHFLIFNWNTITLHFKAATKHHARATNSGVTD